MSAKAMISLSIVLLGGTLLLQTLDQAEPPDQWIELPASSDLVKSRSQLAKERVIQLPDDGNKWQWIEVYDDSAASKRLRAMIATTPRLQSLRAQTQCYEYTAQHPWVWQNHRGDPQPAVYLQEPSGGQRARPIYKAVHGNMPEDGETLADEIERQIADCCPDVRPNAPNDKERPLSRIPILRPQSTPTEGGTLLQLLLLAGAAAFAGGYFLSKQD